MTNPIKTLLLAVVLLLGMSEAGFAQVTLLEDISFERSSLFSMDEGDVLEDHGVITVAEGLFARRESFEAVRHSDGRRTVTSVSVGLNNPYRVEGRWSYDSDGQAVSATGKANYDGLPADVSIRANPPTATISVRSISEDRSVIAPCNPDCLIDLAPSALPMFSMTRQFRGEFHDRQTYRWIAHALIVDQSLLEGRAELELHKTQFVLGERVSQYIFVETMKNEDSGEITSFPFNLYVTTDHSPLAFATKGGTVGTRSGFELLVDKMPPVFWD